MVRGRLIRTPEDFTAAFRIRQSVFQREQGIPAELDFDGRDAESLLVLVLEGETPVATARMLPENGEWLIGRVAVLPEYRGQEYGSFAVRILAEQAFSRGAARVLVNAQEGAAGFYRKLGFTSCGAPFAEAGLTHIPMQWEKKDFCGECGHPCGG